MSGSHGKMSALLQCPLPEHTAPGQCYVKTSEMFRLQPLILSHPCPQARLQCGEETTIFCFVFASYPSVFVNEAAGRWLSLKFFYSNCGLREFLQPLVICIVLSVVVSISEMTSKKKNNPLHCCEWDAVCLVRRMFVILVNSDKFWTNSDKQEEHN